MEKKCQCCGNEIEYSSRITSYWLIGKLYVWLICYTCHTRPFRKAIFLQSKNDLSTELLKKFGLSLGYTKKEIVVK